MQDVDVDALGRLFLEVVQYLLHDRELESLAVGNERLCLIGRLEGIEVRRDMYHEIGGGIPLGI
jgi:hypothetical protein